MKSELSMNELAHHVTLNVRITGERIFWARWWVARKLMLIAAFVAGCGIEIKTKP